MELSVRGMRMALLFAMIVILLIMNVSQSLRNARLKEEAGKAARILAWNARLERFGWSLDYFGWSHRRRVHTQNLRVLKYTLSSPKRFRIEVESDEDVFAWDSSLRSIAPEVDGHYSEFTVVFSRISPGRFRVHLTGQDGICREFEVDGDFGSTDEICNAISGGGILYCDEPHKFISANSDAFRLNVSAEVLCD